MNRKTTFVIIVAILLSAQIWSVAQSSWKSPEILKRERAAKYRLAQQYEQQGAIERATILYRDLFDQDPRNGSYYSRYSNLLFVQKKYPELEQVISTYLSYHPGDEGAQIDLGRLYFLQGDTLRAEQHWQQSWKESQYSQNYTRLLFHGLIMLQAYDLAEEVIRTARDYYQNESLFAVELANFFRARGEYLKSTREFLNYGRQQPRNYQYVSNQILRFPGDSSLFAQIDSLIQQEIEDSKRVKELYQLRADLLFRQQHYTAAIDQVLIVEALSGNRGDAVLDLAGDLLNVAEYRLAEQLYTTIIGKPEFRSVVPKALLGLADAFEREMLADESCSPLDYFYRDNIFFVPVYIYGIGADDYHIKKAFSVYDSMIVTLPRSVYTARALYRLGELRYRVLHDIDGAARLYDDALKAGADIDIRYRCIVRQADLMIARGNLDGAAEYIRQNRRRFEGTDVEKSLAVRYILSWYYRGEVDSALVYTNELMNMTGVADPLFNDALEFQNFTEQFLVGGDDENRQYVREFLKSEWLIHQSKLSEARENLVYLIENAENSGVVLPARYRLLQIELFFRNREQAETILDRILREENQFADDALFMMAETADIRDGDREYAARWYQRLLQEYPNSFTTEIVRKRLRRMQSELNIKQEL